MWHGLNRLYKLHQVFISCSDDSYNGVLLLIHFEAESYKVHFQGFYMEVVLPVPKGMES